MSHTEVDLNFYQKKAYYAGRIRGIDGKYYHQYAILDQNQSDDPSAGQPPHETNDFVNYAGGLPTERYIENRLQFLTDETRTARERLIKLEATGVSENGKAVWHSSDSKSTSYNHADFPVHLREKALQYLKKKHGVVGWTSMNTSEKDSAVLQKCKELQSLDGSEGEGAALAKFKAAEFLQPSSPAKMEIDPIPAPQQTIPVAAKELERAKYKEKRAQIARKRKLEDQSRHPVNFSSSPFVTLVSPAPAQKPSAVEASIKVRRHR